MNNFPSKLTMIVSILLLAVFSTLKYSTKLNSQLFQLKFDWNDEQVISESDNLVIDSISYNYLAVSGLSEKYNPSNQNTFSVNVSKGERYFFRFINYERNDKKFIFRAVEWLTGVPEKPHDPVSIIESDIPLQKNKGKSIVTLGNELLVKDEAKYFRRKIAIDKEVNFEGRVKDVFNYKHEAVNSENWEEKWDEVEDVPPADVYILFGIVNENKITDKSYRNKLSSFLNELAHRKETQKIIWILSPYVKNKTQNARNQVSNQYISSLKMDKLQLLDAYSIFEKEETDYLMADSIQLNKYGYEKLADKTAELLK